MKYIYILILIICISCKFKESDRKQKNPKELKNNRVIIEGETNDSEYFIKNMSFLNDSYFYGTNHMYLSKSLDGKKIKIQLNKINTSQTFEFVAFERNIVYNTRIFVTLGDSIHFKLEKGNLRFKGKNEDHYNFYLEMDKNNNQWTKLSLKEFNNDLEKYKFQCDSLYNNRVNFLDNYISKHKSISKEFINTVKEEFFFEHLLNLIKPRFDVDQNFSVNTHEDLASIVERSKRKEGDFLDLNKYLDNVKLKDFNKPHLTKNLFFKMSIIPFVRQYFVKSNEIPYSKEAFKEELSFIKKNFDDTIVQYATGRLIVDYFEKGFGKDNNTADFMKNTIKTYKEIIKDSSTITAMKDIELELNTINKKLPKELKELVVNLTKDTVDFSKTLQQKKIKVIDFWASWCQPCIEEIIESKSKRERIASKYNVEFLYLSIDKDTQKWIAKSIDLYQFLPENQQFKIFDHKKSKLIKYLNLKSSFGITIPRYVILDENNTIINNNAPKPSNENFESIIKKIN